MVVRILKRLVPSVVLGLLVSLPFWSTGAQSPATRRVPGKQALGTLLPNGWTLTPEGRQLPINDLPLNLILSPDGRYVLVTTNGNGDQSVEIIDRQTGQI